jgi:hypothetical protein
LSISFWNEIIIDEIIEDHILKSLIPALALFLLSTFPPLQVDVSADDVSNR